MNYKKEYGITLKKAKEIAKLRNGRLPQPGYECFVWSGLTQVKGLDGITREHEYKIYLQNSAGKLKLYRWINVNPFH